MFLKKIKLENFRSYKKLSLSLKKEPIILFGENTQGKTNLLEAIYFLSILRSYRARNDRNVIGWDGSYAKIEGEISGGDSPKIATVIDFSGPDTKAVKINHRKRKITEAMGKFKAILFSPDDINLVYGSPAMRRRFLNILISQIDRGYINLLLEFRKILIQRNNLLAALRPPGISDDLDVWTEKIARAGATIIKKRFEVIQEINELIKEGYGKISGEGASLKIWYRSTIGSPLLPLPDLERAYIEKLKQKTLDEIILGCTTMGPHRDDFSFSLNGKPLSEFGSRGEARSAILALKIAEAEVVEKNSKDSPILLLDDIFSELDRNRQKLLWGLIGGRQAVITTTTLSVISMPPKLKHATFEVKGGEVKKKSG